MNLDKFGVLIDEVGFLRPCFIDGAEGVIRDYSALNYQLAELLSFGVLKTGVPLQHSDEVIIQNIPKLIRERIKLVDGNLISYAKRNALLKPILEECMFTVKGTGILQQLDGAKNIDEVVLLFFELQIYLCGLESKLVVDVDVEAILRSIEILRSDLKSTQSLQTLSILGAVFRSYRRSQVDTFILGSMNTHELSLVFNRFVEDELFNDISRDFGKLGYTEKINRSIKSISRKTKDLLKMPFAKEVANYATRGIATASGIPTPTMDQVSTVFETNYLPPILPTKKLMLLAKNRWQEADTELITTLDLSNKSIVFTNT